jgi:dolichol-phosphate mannosyltransferase
MSICVPVYNEEDRVFRRECVGKLKLYRGLHRFIPTLLKMDGFTVIEIPVSNHPRLHGQSKYGVWNRLFKSFRDLLAIRWMKSRLLGYEAETERYSSEELSDR